MNRATGAFLSAIFFLFATLHSAAAFTDPAKRYTIDFPAGWSKPVVDAEGNAQSNAPGQSDQVWCRANSHDLATLTLMSQAQLNKDYGAPLDQPTWAAVLSVDAAKMTLVAHESRVVNGVIVQIGTFNFQKDVLGIEATARFASYILPGRMVNAGCFAGTKTFPAMKATFEKTITSLKPL